MSLGFSIFRIMYGIVFFTTGYDKLTKLISVNFKASSYELLNMFLNVFHGPKSTVSPYVQIFFPSAILYIFSYCVPFIELAIGILLILGLYRKCAASLGIILMGILLVGTHAALGILGVQLVIEQALYGLIFFTIYKNAFHNYNDPIAIDTMLFRLK